MQQLPTQASTQLPTHIPTHEIRATTYTHAAASMWTHVNPVRMVRQIWSSRALAYALARREVENRYKANALGLIWAIVTPLMLLGVYTFVFAVVFPARWPAPIENVAGNVAGAAAATNLDSGIGYFALNVFLGLLVYSVFREVVTRSPGLIVGNRQYVKRVVFPLESLSVADLMVSLFNFAIGCTVWLVGFVAITGTLPHWEAILVPVLLVPVALTALGVSWLMSAIGVFLRDIQHAVELSVTVLMFLTPVFYPMERVPKEFRVYLEWNPVAQVIEAGRAAAVAGTQPDWSRFAIAFVASLVVACAGYAVFSKGKRAFADVL